VYDFPTGACKPNIRNIKKNEIVDYGGTTCPHEKTGIPSQPPYPIKNLKKY